jgi:hypothetical protein
MNLTARVLLIFLLAVPLVAGAWTVTADFEQGTLGARADGASGFGYATTQTFYSDTRSFSGSKSAIAGFLVGIETGAGGSMGLPYVSEGGEIWARGYYYFSSPWSWSASPVSKILRIKVLTSSGSHVAWHSIIASSTGKIILSNEVQAYQPTSAVDFDINQWQSLELYVKFSATAGNGVIRIWKNGVVVLEDTLRRTLSNASDTSGWSNVFTWWNGGHPQTQYAWIDDFIWTNERPANQDAAGNYMIGPANWGGGPSSHTVTPSAGANGSISPNTAQTVTTGSTAQFTVTPNSGYTGTVGGTCGGSPSTATGAFTYTTNSISGNCTVSASFSAIAEDTTAPVLSGLTPAGDLPSRVTSVSLGLTTDEIAACRFGFPGDAWGDMTPFSSTNNTVHLHNISVKYGGVYRYCFLCQDAALNTSDETCTRFSIPAAPKRPVLG